MADSKVAPVIASLRTIMRKYLLLGLLGLAVSSCSIQVGVRTPPTAAIQPTFEPIIIPMVPLTDTPRTLKPSLTPATAAPTAPTRIAQSLPTRSPTPTGSTPIFTLLPRTPGPTLTPKDTLTPGGPTLTPYTLQECRGDRLCMLWFVGLGSGTEPGQIEVEQKVKSGLNAFQDKVQLILEVVPYTAARDAFRTQIDSGNAPDVVGPLGWDSANFFHGEWLDLKEQIAVHPEALADINPSLLAPLDGPEGQIGFPTVVYPSAMFYNRALFERAGLVYPPAEYGPNLGPASYLLDGQQVEWNWDTIREVARRLTLDVQGRNATQAGFDRSHIVQYGFSWNYQDAPAFVGSFWASGSYLAADGRTAQIPQAWRAAWEWTYAGMWGDQPWIPTKPFSQFNNFNDFNNGKAAMTVQPVWLTCCLEKLSTWDLGVLPAYQGKVSGRMDVDFLAVPKGARHLQESFQVLNYLLNQEELYVGKKSPSGDASAVFGNGIPVRSSFQPAWLAARQAEFPKVKNWGIFFADLHFPDIPNTGAYIPNFTDAWARGQAFYDRMASTGNLDLDKEIAIFRADLQAIFDKAR